MSRNRLINFITFAEYPRQIKYIMWNEAAERYAYYGMRAILVIYMYQYLNMSEQHSTAYFSYFVSLSYFVPLIGAYIADKYLGKYRTIVIFSIIYALGFIVLAATRSTTGLFVAMIMIAIGTGGIKPCVSTYAGDQIASDPKYHHLMSKAFSMLYFMINLGALLSSFITPITRQLYGPGVAFSIPAILMLLAVVIFLLGTRQYHNVPVQRGASSLPFFRIILTGLLNLRSRNRSDIFLSGAYSKFSRNDVCTTHNLLQIVKLFLFMIFFFAVWDQQGSTWVVQAHQMNQNFLGMTVPPDIMQTFNCVFILTLVPIFNAYIYPWCGKYCNMTPFKKVGAGIILAGISFITIGIYQQFLDAGIQLNIMWQVLSYFFLTIAELLVVITLMEFAYSQAPENMKSTIMALLYLTISLGNLLAGVILQTNIFTTGSPAFFYFFALICILLGLLFIPVSKTYRHVIA